MMMDSIAETLLLEAIIGCCGDSRWRRRLCQYHQGYEAGLEAFIDKTLAATARNDGQEEVGHQHTWHEDDDGYRWCQACDAHGPADLPEPTLIDGLKRPPELSPEEREKRADQRDRGVLNDGSQHADNA